MALFHVKYKRDLAALEQRVRWAIENESALTLTYREIAKDPVTDKPIISRIPEHQEYDTIVRTVEPYELEVSAAGDLYMRTLDRTKRAPRSYRLDRVLLYSTHAANTRVLEHAVPASIGA